ncbi:prepilin peptidase [Pseudomonas salmasensis]
MALVLGLIVGSFLNVLVWRLPKMLEREWRAQAHEILDLPAEPGGPAYNLMRPNSCCPHCNQPIRPWENIPVLSYLLLRGALCPLPRAHQPALSPHRTGVRADLRRCRLALRIRLASRRGDAVELGLAGDEPD